tara:strand:- start:403 stop:729 length:327 start_codon:yes stop_codon:yes gene_type:complete
MGKIKHHIGAIGGGINLSKSKTPHDADIKYDPINDRTGSPFYQGEKLKNRISKLSNKHKKLYDAHEAGGDVDMDKLGRVEDKLEKKEEKYVKKYGNSPYSLLNNILKK